ncbi:hypothetical protein GQX73_g5109 [Xylaria multiplex]|uniref:Uncharacterized protein n=1 Tax=Xylaria multiplex TaxID=323545 RepID=A0A7C8IUV2_9PEZI|nr:hypothetical protein GQX73_g5109 [Xylaria multiplex]
MASSTDQALQIINQSYKDILIQAGKHFKVMAKDGPGALVGTHSGIRAKASDSLTQYHLALNEIESEIIRAKSVLLRDLENLKAARAPAPAPVVVPAPIPIPIPTPQPAAPPAPMMELPSSAAHSRSLNATATYSSSKEMKTVAPFPDMGMGMSTDVVDLTIGEKKPSPRVQVGTVKSAARSGPPTNVKPSPKPMHKPMPPAKVTPVPPPQIPRLQAMQSSNASTQLKPQPVPQPQKTAQAPQPAQPAHPAQPTQPVQQAAAVKTTQDSAMDGMLGVPSTGTSDGIITGTGNGELNFTDMEFSLAPPPAESQGAPPAPMPEFDLATFAPQSGNSNAATGNTTVNNPTQPPNTSSNMDDLFNLGDTNGGGDNMFDLGGGEVNDSTFDDLFFGNNDSDMAQFDDAYFGL